MTTVLIKRTFFPLAALASIYVLVSLWKLYGRNLPNTLVESWKNTSKNFSFIALTLMLIVIGSLFIERYGMNFVRYGTFWPLCHEVQSPEVCAEFGPWRRDYITIKDTKPTEPPFGNIFSFSQHWTVWLTQGYYVLFSHRANAKPLPGDPYGSIAGQGWLPLPITVGFTALAAGSIAIIWQRKRILNDPYLRLALYLAIGFIIVQFIYNYRAYLRLWRPVAIQARYTYPILIILFATMIQSAAWTIDSKRLKSALLLAFIALYVWGGGIAGWVIRSPDNWQWQRPYVQSANDAASNVLKHIVIN